MVQNKPKRPPGRPRAYDPDRALANATQSFWRAGFAATSLDDLSAATGMQRPSLYGAFGDKRELYLATLDRYVEASRGAMQAALARRRPDRRGARARLRPRPRALFRGPEGAAGLLPDRHGGERSRAGRARAGAARVGAAGADAHLRGALSRRAGARRAREADRPERARRARRGGAALDRTARSGGGLARLAPRVLPRGGAVAVQRGGDEACPAGDAPAIARARIRNRTGRDVAPPTQLVSARRGPR